MPKKLPHLIFLLALFISPLIFFTDLTRNPYLIQERVYQVLLVAVLLLIGLPLLWGRTFRKKEINLPRTFLDGPLLIFFSIMVLSTVFSLFRFPQYRWAIAGYSTRHTLMFIFSGLIPFYFVAGMAKEKNFLRKVQWTVIAAASVASFYALMQFLRMDFIWPRDIDPYGQRSISTFGNPNFLSAYLMVVIFWITGFLLSEKKRNPSNAITKRNPSNAEKKSGKSIYKGLWFFLLFLNLTGLGITMTRSTFAGLIAGLSILIYFLIKRSGWNVHPQRTKLQLYLITGCVLVGGIIFSLLSPQFSQRMRGMLSVKGMGSALTQRMLIWESSYNMFKDTPVIGRGWGNFEIFYKTYQGKIIERESYRHLRTHANNAHNFFLEVLTQTGIIGTGLYVLLIIVFIRFAIKIYQRSAGSGHSTGSGYSTKIYILVLTVSGISFWVDNLLNVSLFFPMPAMAFWLNMGLLAAEGRRISGYPVKKISIGGGHSARKKSLFAGVAMSAVACGVIYFNYIYFASSVYFFRGFKNSRQGNFKEAERNLVACHRLYPLNVDNNYELGNVYARLISQDKENLNKSIWAYREAIRANPGYDEIYFNLAIMHLKKEEIEKATQYLKKTIELNPLTSDAYRSLGDIAARGKKYDEAIAFYEKAISIKPEDVDLHNNYGYYNEMAGNIKEALKSYVQALEINNNFTPARLNISRANARFSNLKPAREINKYFQKADNLIGQKKWNEAIEILKKILELDPANLKALLYSGNVYFKLKKTTQAKGLYKLLLAIDPNNQTALANLNLIK